MSNHKVSKNVVAVEDMSEADKEMMKVMGFCNFDTTKNSQTDQSDNQVRYDNISSINYYVGSQSIRLVQFYVY